VIRETEFERLMRVAEDHAEIHARLVNWARWSRDKIRQGHCRSIEYRYLAPRIKEAEDLNASPQPDPLDAEKLHSVVCDLPVKHRWMIHLWYIHRAPAQFMRRKLGIARDALPVELDTARVMVRNGVRRG